MCMYYILTIFGSTECWNKEPRETNKWRTEAQKQIWQMRINKRKLDPMLHQTNYNLNACRNHSFVKCLISWLILITSKGYFCVEKEEAQRTIQLNKY